MLVAYTDVENPLLYGTKIQSSFLAGKFIKAGIVSSYRSERPQ